MGAVIALLLVLSTLTACAGSTVTDVKNAMPAMAAMPQEDTAVTYVVNVAEYTDTICDEDGTELVMYSYQVPELQVLREDGSQVQEGQSPTEKAALATAETFNSRFSDWTEESLFSVLPAYCYGRDRRVCPGGPGLADGKRRRVDRGLFLYGEPDLPGLSDGALGQHCRCV